MEISPTSSASTFADDAVPVVSPPNVQPRRKIETIELEQQNNSIRNSKIMIVDDEELVVRVVKRFLSADGYSNFITTNDPSEAIDLIDRERPDVVLMDIMMPKITGLDLLAMRRHDRALHHIPFIVLSAASEIQIKHEAIRLGATDFLAKPIDTSELTVRVKNSLVVKWHHDNLARYAEELERKVEARARQLERSREQIIHCLARAAEYRDNETGAHVIRVGKYCGVIASELGFSSEYCRQIALAAQLHDVGKIGIPDAVLLNPGRLSKEDFDIMKQHCLLGCEIMEPLVDSCWSPHTSNDENGPSASITDSPTLELAALIARTHHEKWDGSGYPNRLKGDQIPIEGRITCVADVYDALCSERPYKPAFPREKCLEIMLSERGTRFDPTVLDAFFRRLDEIDGIRDAYDDKKQHEQLLANRAAFEKRFQSSGNASDNKS